MRAKTDPEDDRVAFAQPGLMELRGPLLQRTLRGPGARKADGCPQPKHARLLLLRGLRGDGVFSIDLGLGKRFYLFSIKDQRHTLQFRAEAFNVTNTVRFDVNSLSLDITNQAKFGVYSNTLTRPRIFQFSARYEF